MVTVRYVGLVFGGTNQSLAHSESLAQASHNACTLRKLIRVTPHYLRFYKQQPLGG